MKLHCIQQPFRACGGFSGRPSVTNYSGLWKEFVHVGSGLVFVEEKKHNPPLLNRAWFGGKFTDFRFAGSGGYVLIRCEPVLLHRVELCDIKSNPATYTPPLPPNKGEENNFIFQRLNSQWYDTVSYPVFLAQSATKDHIRAENKLQSVS